MTRKQLLAIVIAAGLLVVIGAVVKKSRSSGWKASQDAGDAKVLPDLPINDVAGVEITGKAGTVQLARKDGVWCVAERYNYPANYGTLKEFMVGLQDLKAAQTVKIGPSQYGRLDLGDPGVGEGTGTKVTFKDASGKELGRIVLGKEHKKQADDAAPQPGPMGMMGGGGGNWPDGRYLLVPATNKVVLVSETFSSVADDPSRWVDKEFFKVADVRTVSLSEGDAVQWQASRETKTGDLKLEGDVPEGKEIDTGKLSSIKSAFGWASFTDVADPALAPEETGMDAPKVYKAEDFDGVVTTVLIGKESADGKVHLQAKVAYAGPSERVAPEGESEEDKKKNDDEFAKKLAETLAKVEKTNKRLEGWTYLVSKYTVDTVLKSRDDLFKDKPKPVETKDETPAEGDGPAETPAVVPAPAETPAAVPAPAETPAAVPAP